MQPEAAAASSTSLAAVRPTRPRGRPRSADPTLAICFKIPQSLYDEYCLASLQLRTPVRVLMKRVLKVYAHQAKRRRAGVRR